MPSAHVTGLRRPGNTQSDHVGAAGGPALASDTLLWDVESGRAQVPAQLRRSLGLHGTVERVEPILARLDPDDLCALTGAATAIARGARVVQKLAVHWPMAGGTLVVLIIDVEAGTDQCTGVAVRVRVTGR